MVAACQVPRRTHHAAGHRPRGLSLRYLWRRTGDPRDNLRVGALFSAAYWVAQAGAILVPGAAMVDPQFADRIPTVAGVRPNQLVLDALLLLLVALGYRWQRAATVGQAGTASRPGTVDSQ